MASFTRTTRTRLQATAATRAESPGDQPAGLLVLDRYRLHRPLGAGGFGTVWMARDERLERDVAVKVLARERIVDGRFEREARAAARLSHPGIVTLYEAAVDDEAAYLVSELVRGSTLARLLQAGRLSDRDVLEIGIGLSDALAHAHGHGVVHRDVKPSNVLVPDQPASPGQLAKLTDFGVARLIDGEVLTRSGDVVGTAEYMAPEQAQGEDTGAAADLYSLALVLYEALTGVNPLAAGGAGQRARRLGAHLPPLRRHRRDLPRELGHALDLALRPRARERGSIEELRGGLVASLHQVGDEPGVVETRPSARVEPAWAGTHAAAPGRESGRIFHVLGQAPEEGPPSARRRPGWQQRILGAGAAGLAAAWLLTLLPGARPGAATAAGLLGAAVITALPRIGWIVLLGAISALLATQGLAGAATVVALAGAVPIVLLPRHRSSWSLGATAAALGVVSLAGAWPALAGRARTIWERIGLGAVGWIWTALAGALAGHGLYTRLPARIPAGWAGSAATAVKHVLPRVFEPGVLASALVWGAAAALVPLISRQALALQVVLASMWSAALASGTVTLLHAWHGRMQTPSGVVAVGAVGAWIGLLGPALIKREEPGSRSPDTAGRLA